MTDEESAELIDEIMEDFEQLPKWEKELIEESWSHN